jgi:hypothetical protein
MKNTNFLVAAMLLLLLSGCASVTKDIQIDAAHDQAVKFSGYKSYAWLGDIAALHDPEGKWQPPRMNITEDIKFLIDRELRKHGIYNYAEAPDLAVVFFIGADMEAMQLKADPKTKQDILSNVPAAALVVALIDAKTEYVVWVGEATGEIQKNLDEATIRKRLDYAVTEIFRKLPKD